MAMERNLLRLIGRAQAHARLQLVQRGAALPMRTYASSGVSAGSDKFSSTELRKSAAGQRRPVWQEWSRRYADSSAEKVEAPQGNKEYHEFGTHKTTTTKRYAVGRTDIAVDGVQAEQAEKEMKEKAKEILQQVGEKIDETMEEAQIRQLQEKLAATEGIGKVVHELYNQQEDHTEYTQTGEGVKA